MLSKLRIHHNRARGCCPLAGHSFWMVRQLHGRPPSRVTAPLRPGSEVPLIESVVAVLIADRGLCRCPGRCGSHAQDPSSSSLLRASGALYSLQSSTRLLPSLQNTGSSFSLGGTVALCGTSPLGPRCAPPGPHPPPDRVHGCLPLSSPWGLMAHHRPIEGAPEQLAWPPWVGVCEKRDEGPPMPHKLRCHSQGHTGPRSSALRQPTFPWPDHGPSHSYFEKNSARYLRVNQGEREVIETREKRVKRALERLKRPMAGATENKDID
ncbi:hypothetical protein NDU88_000820 [Pleurodeles waltl]|uniref:Uncharacterized protein n=1 Tax=Pleurodeles waltl TaxID=8319 RepID=A0AAV7VUM2_PLEWA|nr:hypothetical protein NDU88_000820 [Pleurodeles waltl]